MRFILGSAIGIVASPLAAILSLQGCNSQHNSTETSSSQTTRERIILPPFERSPSGPNVVPLLRKTATETEMTLGGGSGVTTTGTTNQLVNSVGAATIPHEEVSVRGGRASVPMRTIISDRGNAIISLEGKTPNASNGDAPPSFKEGIVSKETMSNDEVATLVNGSVNNQVDTPIDPALSANDAAKSTEDNIPNVHEDMSVNDNDKITVAESSDELLSDTDIAVDEFDLFGKAPEGFTKLQWLALVGSTEEDIRWWLNSNRNFQFGHKHSANYLGHTWPTWKGEAEFGNEYSKKFLKSFFLDIKPRYEKLSNGCQLDNSDRNIPWTVSIDYWNKYIDKEVYAAIDDENGAILENDIEVVFFSPHTIADILNERNYLLKFRINELEFEETANKFSSLHGGHQCIISWVRFLNLDPVTDEYISKTKENYRLIVLEIDHMISRFSEDNLKLADESKSVFSQLDSAELDRLIFNDQAENIDALLPQSMS